MFSLKASFAFGGILTVDHLSDKKYNFSLKHLNNESGSSWNLASVANTNVGFAVPVNTAPPNITYVTPQVYGINTPIVPLKPKNTGGAVPATIYGKVTTFAGNGTRGSNDGTGTSASFNNPTRLAEDAMGNVYVADRDNNLIRKITPGGVVTTFANGFNQPNGVIVDGAGNVYVADAASNQIKKITPAGTVSVFAGSGQSGAINGPAATASFNYPYSVAVDGNNNIYVADSQNNLIRKITPAGIVSTLAGGNPFFADGQGTAAGFNQPSCVNVDDAGNIYVADPFDFRVRKITSTGLVTTIAGSGGQGADDGPALSATFNVPAGVATDAAGNIYVADITNDLIRKIDPQGIVTTIAGSGTPGATDGVGNLASFNRPNDVRLNAAGFLYVTDYGNSLVRKVIVTGYTIDKLLPPGLHFDATTGIISGTPNALSPLTDYLITAYNTGGSSKFIVQIEVTDVAPSVAASAVTGSIDACAGSPSDDYQEFKVLGNNLSQNILVTPPSGFMVSVSPVTGFNTQLTLITQNYKVDNIKVYVKAAGSLTPGMHTGDVILSTAGVNDVHVSVKATINNLPVINQVQSQSVCEGALTNAINFTGTADNYKWTNDNPSIGIAATGTGSIPAFTAQNNTNAPATATIQVTPYSSTLSCPGMPVIFNITVNSLSAPSVMINQSAIPCTGQPVSFVAVAANAGNNPTYQWQVNGQVAGVNSPAFSGNSLQAGDKVICIVTGRGSCNTPVTSNTVITTFKTPVTPSITITQPIKPCQGGGVSFEAATTNAGVNQTYEWRVNGIKSGTNSQFFNIDSPPVADVITCLITNTSDCTTSATVSSNALSPQYSPDIEPSVTITSSVSGTVCVGTSITFTAHSLNGGSNPTYQWYVNGLITGPHSPALERSDLNNGDLVSCAITNNDVDHCVINRVAVSNQLQVHLVQPVVVTISPSSVYPACAGNMLTFKTKLQNEGPVHVYQWQVNHENAGDDSPVFESSSLKNGDVLTCIVSSAFECTTPGVSNVIIIETVAPPSVSFNGNITIKAGESVKLNPIVSGNITGYKWIPSININSTTIATPVVNPTENITYTLEITSAGGCTASAAVTVNVNKGLDITNTFTPNGDGYNDKWEIPSLVYYPGCKVSVFNRYGTRLFYSVGYARAWDGTYKNAVLPSGTYYYLIDPNNGDPKISGHVSILK